MECAPRLHIIATTDEGTRTALAETRRRLSHRTTDPVVLLVPQLISPSNVLAGPREATRLTAGYQELACAAGVEAIVRLCHCRTYGDAFRWMLGRASVIVIGGRRRWGWPTAAQRMTRELRRAGHQVIFADVR